MKEKLRTKHFIQLKITVNEFQFLMLVSIWNVKLSTNESNERKTQKALVKWKRRSEANKQQQRKLKAVKIFVRVCTQTMHIFIGLAMKIVQFRFGVCYFHLFLCLSFVFSFEFRLSIDATSGHNSFISLFSLTVRHTIIRAMQFANRKRNGICVCVSESSRPRWFQSIEIEVNKRHGNRNNKEMTRRK